MTWKLVSDSGSFRKYVIKILPHVGKRWLWKLGDQPSTLFHERIANSLASCEIILSKSLELNSFLNIKSLSVDSIFLFSSSHIHCLDICIHKLIYLPTLSIQSFLSSSFYLCFISLAINKMLVLWLILQVLHLWSSSDELSAVKKSQGHTALHSISLYLRSQRHCISWKSLYPIFVKDFVLTRHH